MRAFAVAPYSASKAVLKRLKTVFFAPYTVPIRLKAVRRFDEISITHEVDRFHTAYSIHSLLSYLRKDIRF